MKYKLVISPESREDIQNIKEYYTLEFGTESGLKVIRAIVKTLRRLHDSPDSGSRIPDSKLDEKGYRMVLSRQYAAIYRLEGEVIYIYRIISTKTKYKDLFLN